MKKFFLLLLAPALLAACHSRQNARNVAVEAQTVVNDTAVSIYEGWAESLYGQAVLYDLLVLTPLNGGDEVYQLVMSYTDSATMTDTSIMVPVQMLVMTGIVGMQNDTLIVFNGLEDEEVSLWSRGDSMLVGSGRDVKTLNHKTAHVLHRLK